MMDIWKTNANAYWKSVINLHERSSAVMNTKTNITTATTQEDTSPIWKTKKMIPIHSLMKTSPYDSKRNIFLRYDLNARRNTMNIEQIGFGSSRHRYKVTGEITCSPQQLADACFAEQRPGIKNYAEKYYAFQIQSLQAESIKEFLNDLHPNIELHQTIVVLMIDPLAPTRYSI